MSLFRDTMRPPPLASDAAVRRYVEMIRAEIEPDPLFRRRLRGLVVNQFVAVREGSAPAVRAPSRAMGRLGRACLYASVAVAMSVGVTMAASQSALPGDPLYGVKLRIEQLRVVSLPAQFQDDLAVYSLTERINELNRLAAAGRTEQVEALAAVIEDQVAALAAMEIVPEGNGLLASRLDVLETLVDRLSPKAQQALERAMAGAPGLVTARPGPATGHGDGASAGAGHGQRQPADTPADEPATTADPANGGAKQPPGQAEAPASPTPAPSPTSDPGTTPAPKARDAEEEDQTGAEGGGQNLNSEDNDQGSD